MTMIVTHEMGFAREVADNIIFFDGSNIVEMAPPEKFFSQPEHERTKRFGADPVGHCCGQCQRSQVHSTGRFCFGAHVMALS